MVAPVKRSGTILVWSMAPGGVSWLTVNNGTFVQHADCRFVAREPFMAA